MPRDAVSVAGCAFCPCFLCSTAAAVPPCCRAKLSPYTQPPPLSLLARMGLRIMPSARQLEDAGRHDLVEAIKRAGGFLEVAQAG